MSRSREGQIPCQAVSMFPVCFSSRKMLWTCPHFADGKTEVSVQPLGWNSVVVGWNSNQIVNTERHTQENSVVTCHWTKALALALASRENE